MEFIKGQKVWCRPRLVDKPMEGVFIREISEAERKEGYRYGYIIEINGSETWVRADLCGLDIEKIALKIS